MLTSAAVKSARVRARPYKLTDGQGLHLYVAPTGLKSFRMRFRVAGREQLLVLGQFPEIDLGAAREAAERARDALRAGEDPRLSRAARPAIDRSFATIARAWHAHQSPRWSPRHAADVIESLERDVFSAIGAVDIEEIGSADVLELLQAVERRGAIETARRLMQRISGVFRFAISTNIAKHDPAAVVRGALAAPPAAGEQLALLKLDDARALYAASIEDAAAIAGLASQFLALTAVRLGALRGMRWDELEGIDLDGAAIGPTAPVWRVPAARMKLARAKKGNARHDHLVPLSRQAVEVLRAARAITGEGGLVFAGRGGTGPLGENAIGALYRRVGYAGRHVPHGWRATFATIMNEHHHEYRVAIDRALAHAPKDKVEAAYNRSQQLGRRRWLFQRWADLLAPDAISSPRG